MNPSSSKRKRDEASLDEPSFKSRPKYDLFLHYSSEDIGKSFVSHLKGALGRKCFSVSDHTKLPVGQEVCSELLKAIQGSQIIVLVFSMNYASSVSCLDELVNIMNYKDKKKLFPVFFNVDPSDVRNQDGLYFNKAFEAHKTKFDGPRVQKWKDALKAAGQLSGQHYKNGDDEDSFICNIVKKLQSMQDPQELHVTDHPVGIESRVEDIISKLRLDSKDVFVLAVLGIGGIGKTTTAKAVYNRIAANFDASCFLEVKHCDLKNPASMLEMQKNLISSLSQNDNPPMINNCHQGPTKIRRFTSARKVILLLDDVTEVEQLKILGIDPNDTRLLNRYFGDGSRIIVTTRDKGSLGNLSYVSYDTRLLNRTESIELFTLLAYKKDETIDTDLVNEIAYCSSGLPLVLEVWGPYFGKLEREQWPNALKTLKMIPHENVQKKLKISYDSLTNRAKKLFLDIACFFDGMDKDFIVKVLHDEQYTTFFWDQEIQGLANKGLVNIFSYGVEMHQVIREMGQEIVRQENEDEPGQRTRLMNDNDILRVMTEYSGTQSVESIDQNIRQGEITGHIDAFRKMKNLRLIKLEYFGLCSDPRNPLGCDCDSMSPLSFPKLKYLEWEFFPMESINIDMCNVVVLRLKDSRLETLWERPKRLEKLKILEVNRSSSLTKTGNFNGLENLEYLDFFYCENLQELDSSVWCLDKLVKLNLHKCSRLKRFPLKMEVKLRSLQELDLSGCESIGFEDDEVIKHFMSSLKETHITSLKLDGCKICKVPSEVGSLTWLKHLDLSSNNFCSLPDSLVKLDQLETIDLQYCSSLQSIPDLPRSIRSVIAWKCVCLTTLPSSMSELTSLEELNLSGCSKLGIEDPQCLMKLTGLTSLTTLEMENCNVSQVPSEIGNLVSLQTLELSGNTFSSLPDSFRNLLQLSDRKINECSNLTSLPFLPSSMSELTSLEELNLSGCSKLGIEDPECLMKLTGLTSLTTLEMENCNVSQVPSEIGNLVSLQTLELSGNTFSSLPDSFRNLLQLSDLKINECSNLTSLPLLPPLLEDIQAWGCKSLDVMPSTSVVIDDLCGCPTTPALNMTNHPYKFSKCVLAKYTEESFLSRLQIHLDDDVEEFPIWCHNVFCHTRPWEFMAPRDFDRKICGIIFCLRTVYTYGYVYESELQNKTKGTSCRLIRDDNLDFDGGMCIMFIPLDNTTLMVEAGDSLAIHLPGDDGEDFSFYGEDVLGFGVCLIYREGEGEGADDEMEVEPTTNQTTPPFNFNPPIPNHVPRDDDDEFENLLSEDHLYNINSASDEDLHNYQILDDADFHPFFNDADFHTFFNGEMEPTTNQTTPFNFNSITNHEVYNLLVQDEEYPERLPRENDVDYSDSQITEFFGF